VLAAQEYVRVTCFNAVWLWVVLRAGLDFPDEEKRLIMTNMVQASAGRYMRVCNMHRHCNFMGSGLVQL
jgi:hypothetical protein